MVDDSKSRNVESAEITDVKEQNRRVNNDLDKRTPVGEGEKPKAKSEKSEKPEPRKASIRSKATFPWSEVAFWNSDGSTDKLAQLSTKKKIESYVVDHFYGDWYWNCALIIGTCFFSWLVARLGGGILSMGLVLLFTNSVYRLEFRRFNRDIRDDMVRLESQNRLENELESMEWLNSFLDKFWVIYMPALSEQVMFQANEVLKDQAPGFGIEAISLDEFTLGSKAPRVESIKSYPRKSHDLIVMDWAFSFTPNDTDDMTKNEIKKKINPKVALGVTVGKAFISKSLPILVEDMSFRGRMNIKLKLSHNFPHVKMVSVQFLEPPTFDYALKPVGGDTFGLDIMSFIPGLSSFVSSLIHSNLRPMLYAPNSLDVDVEEIIAQQSNDSTGVVAVTIVSCSKLRLGGEANKGLNPYVQLKLSANADVEENTNVKKDTDSPVFLDTKYLLVNKLDGNNLSFNVFNFVEDKLDDQLIGNVDFHLTELLQKDIRTGVVKNIKESGLTVGKITFDLRYFPTLEPEVLEDGRKQPVTDTEVGILKLNLHEAKNLDISNSVVGLLNPYAEIFINNELMKSCRKLRQTNEPSWNQSFESLITQQSKTDVQILIKDAVDSIIVGKLDANLQDLIFETSRGQEWITAPSINPSAPDTKFRITASWKALSMVDKSIVKNEYTPPIGGLRLHLRSANGLKNLESVGKVDPYARALINGKIKAKTPVFADTVDPVFNSVFFLPVSNEHQHILLEVMDKEVESNDRSLGTVAISVNEFIKKNPEGYYMSYEGAEEVLKQPILYNGADHGMFYYSVSFVPTLPILTQTQIKHQKDHQKELEEQRKEEQKKKQKEEELARKYPDDYEWVDVDDDVLEPPYENMPLETAIKYRTGDIVAHVLSGRFEKPDIYVHTLFDDHAFPSGVSPKSDGRFLRSSSDAEAFIRDLPNSKIIFRVAKKFDVEKENEIIAEKIYDTIDIVKKSYDKPLKLRVGDGNEIEVQLEFIPSAVKLAPLDTILDVGHLELDLLGAENISSADSNGKSDPFLSVKLDGVEIYKTDKKRKTLSPLWNEAVSFPMLSRSRQVLLLEVYDWDLTHDDRLLGRVNLDVSSIEPFHCTQFKVPLDTKGNLNLRATFKPEYIRPKLNSEGGLPIDLAAVGAIPLKAVGGVADFAAGAVGGGLGLAADGVTGGASFIKGFGRSKKRRNKSPTHEGDETLDTVDTSNHGDDMSTQISDVTRDTTPSKPSTPESDSQGAAKTEEEKAAEAELGSQKSSHSIVNAIPNIHREDLPPPQKPNTGRSRASSSSSSSIANSTMTSRGVPGRVNVVSASGFDVSSLEIKTVLKSGSKERPIHKTRAAKKNSEGTFTWNESTPFKASDDAQLVFFVREHRTFGKSSTIANTSFQLSSTQTNGENITLDVGSGSLTINIRFIEVR